MVLIVKFCLQGIVMIPIVKVLTGIRPGGSVPLLLNIEEDLREPGVALLEPLRGVIVFPNMVIHLDVGRGTVCSPI